MANITANDVKLLRERTGSGMMDCKKALVACEGNIDEAIDWLRKKGLASASKKAGRVAADGLVAIAGEGNCVALVELNSETDFVAKNEKFQEFARTVVELACDDCCDLESLKKKVYPGTDKTVEEELTNLIAIIGENMQIRRVEHVCIDDGVVATYVHNKISDNLGKIGVAIAIDGCDCETVRNMGKQIAMHIAAANPQYLNISDIPSDVLARERAVVSEIARNSGKPEAVIEKMVEGRLKKFYEEVVLMEQVFVVDGESKIKDIVDRVGKQCGCEISISRYVKFVLGEGIEKQEVDFAGEVAAQLK